jgi:hypothetical protein
VNIINDSIVLLNSDGYIFRIGLNGSLLDKIYIGINSGPENIVQIGDKMVVYGDSSKLSVLPLSVVFDKG